MFIKWSVILQEMMILNAMKKNRKCFVKKKRQNFCIYLSHKHQLQRLLDAI